MNMRKYLFTFFVLCFIVVSLFGQPVTKVRLWSLDYNRYLTLLWSENDTAHRFLYFYVNGGHRIINLNGDFTLSGSNQVASWTVSGLTPSRAVVSGAGGLLATSATTDAEIGYLSGVTSSIQTQLGAKEPTIAAGTTAQYWCGDKSWQTFAHNLLSASHADTTAASAVRGDLITGQAVVPLWKRLARGTMGQMLYTDGADVLWGTVRTPDNDSSDYLRLIWNENSAACYVFYFKVNGNNRTLDLSGNLTLSGNNTVAAWTVGSSTGALYANAGVLTTESQLAAIRGGTGLGSYAVGDILYAPTTTTVGKLADVATGSVLVSGGVDTAPAYSATPTITTSVTVPSVYGSSSASGDLNLYSTSNGTKGYVIAQDPISVPATGRNLKAQWDFEDFIGKLSQRMWTSGYSGTGALTYDSPGTALRPGIISISTGTTNSGYAYSFLSGTTSASPFLFGGGVYTLETDIYITTLSDGTDTYTYRFGFADSGATAPTDGAYFYYTDVGGGGATPNWYRNTVSNTTLTSTNTSIAVVAGSWIRLKVVVNADATSVEYFINDISAGTNTTNIPSGTGRGTGIFNSIVKSAGTTARIISTDWAWVHVNLTTSR